MSLRLDTTVGDALVARAENRPDEVGWVFDDVRVTARGMLTDADRLAAALLDRGVGPGDRVAVWLPNRAEWAVSLFACARIGAVLVALNTRWKPFEAGFVLAHAAPKVLVVQRHFLRIDFAELLADLGWPRGDGPAATVDVIEVGGAGLPGATPWSDLTARPVAEDTAARLRRRTAAVRPEDPVLLQYTSGSTARPKCALIPHRMLLNYGAEVITSAKPRSERVQMSSGELSRRTETIQRTYFQCSPDEDVDDWSEDRIWSELQARLAGDAAHTVPPTGAKGLNLALADVAVLADVLGRVVRKGDRDALDSNTARALSRVWKAQHFSYWMTTMLHRTDEAGEFDERRQLGELAAVVGSEHGRAYLAEA